MPGLEAAFFIGASIHDAPVQMGLDCKLLMIDDGSTDGANEAVVKHATIHYSQHSNQAPPADESRVGRGDMPCTLNHPSGSR